MLRDHPADKQATVVGIPHQQLGQRVAAAVVVTGVRPALADDLVAFARTRLPAYKLPERLVLLPGTPRNPIGKLDRKELAHALEGPCGEGCS